MSRLKPRVGDLLTMQCGAGHCISKNDVLTLVSSSGERKIKVLGVEGNTIHWRRLRWFESAWMKLKSLYHQVLNFLR